MSLVGLEDEQPIGGIWNKGYGGIAGTGGQEKSNQKQVEDDMRDGNEVSSAQLSLAHLSSSTHASTQQARGARSTSH